MGRARDRVVGWWRRKRKGRRTRREDWFVAGAERNEWREVTYKYTGKVSAVKLIRPSWGVNRVAMLCLYSHIGCIHRRPIGIFDPDPVLVFRGTTMPTPSDCIPLAAALCATRSKRTRALSDDDRPELMDTEGGGVGHHGRRRCKASVRVAMV